LRRPEFIARQSGHPSGIIGRLIARIMAMETITVNRRALSLLELHDASRVLEVGSGHGRTLARVAELAPQGFAAGVDISPAMVQMAKRYNRHSIAKRLIEVKGASSDHIPYADESFDRVFAVHTLYFWNDPFAHFREIRRVLRVGGRFVLAFGPKEDKNAVATFPGSVYHFYSINETWDFLTKAGFNDIRIVRETIAARDTVFAVSYR
jgi:ubiquinone/menaquinone biosynthesis C-methylase UbiE